MRIIAGHGYFCVRPKVSCGGDVLFSITGAVREHTITRSTQQLDDMLKHIR
jgi:hypothetical protein